MSKIVFQNEENGYSKSQVDSYIEKLSAAYQAAYDENQMMQRKYSTLIEEHSRLEEESQSKVNPVVLAKTIMDMEMLAQSILNEAKAEAENLKDDALRLVEDANGRAEAVDEKSKIIADTIMLEKANADLTARRIIEAAQAEAREMIDNTRNGIAEVQKIVSMTLTNVQNLLSNGDIYKKADVA